MDHSVSYLQSGSPPDNLQGGNTKVNSSDDLITEAQRPQSLLRNVQVPVLLAINRKVAWGNPCFFDMLGYTASELTGQSTRTYFRNDADYDRIAREGYPALKSGKPYATELILQRRDGKLIWCLITGNAANPQSPLDGCSLWTFVDITERVQAQAREQEAIQREQVETEKMAALGVVVAGVAHEINTPIGVGYTLVTHFKTKTREFSQLFESGGMKRSDLQAYVTLSNEMANQLSTNIGRASELIQSFKKVAVDQSMDDQRVFDLKAYLQEVVMSLMPTLRKTPHTVEIDCPDGIELNSYPGSFSQVVTNFVMNALIHAFHDGMIGTMRITARASEKQVQMSFADNGKGISAENLPKIFDPFFTTRRGAGGSGLGLNIVFNMVTRKLQGRISVSSVEGQGTVFAMELPLVVEAEVQKAKESSSDMMQSYQRSVKANEEYRHG